MMNLPRFSPAKLRALRQSRALSVAQLAAKAEISRAYGYRLESGGVPRPSMVTIIQLATALRCDIHDLLGEEGDQT